VATAANFITDGVAAAAVVVVVVVLGEKVRDADGTNRVRIITIRRRTEYAQNM